MRCDWMLVGSDIRLRAGVLSHWLRGRQPKMTAEVFQSRWCHGEIRIPLQQAGGGDGGPTHTLERCASGATTAVKPARALNPLVLPPWALNRRWYDNSAGALSGHPARACLSMSFFLLLRKKPYMPAKLANCSNISRQLKETSGVGKNKNDARRTWAAFFFFFFLRKKPYMSA